MYHFWIDFSRIRFGPPLQHIVMLEDNLTEAWRIWKLDPDMLSVLELTVDDHAGYRQWRVGGSGTRVHCEYTTSPIEV